MIDAQHLAKAFGRDTAILRMQAEWSQLLNGSTSTTSTTPITPGKPRSCAR